MRLALWCTFGLLPVAIALPFVDDGRIAAVLLIPITFLMAMPPGLSNAALQAIAMYLILLGLQRALARMESP